MTSTHLHTLRGGGVVIMFSTDPDFPQIMADVNVLDSDGSHHESVMFLRKGDVTALRDALDAAIQKGLVR